MLLVAFEPGKEMAIANFFLAIFFLFTISLPLLLITRGDKTESNRDFIAATINPWSQIGEKLELTQVIISGVSPITELQPKLEFIDQDTDEPISDAEELLTIETKNSEDQEESSTQITTTNEEVLAA